MKIFVISLDTDTGADRRSRLNYKYEWIKGNTDLNKVDKRYVDNMINLHNCNPNTKRAKSCHFECMVNILERIVKDKLYNVIICEDDAILKYMPPLEELDMNPETPVLLCSKLHHPTNWKKDTRKYQKEVIHPIIKSFNEGLNVIDYDKIRWSCCACIYYPTPESAQNILEYIYKKKSYRTFDLFLSESKLISYLYYPSPFKIDDKNVSQYHKPNGLIDNYYS